MPQGSVPVEDKILSPISIVAFTQPRGGKEELHAEDRC